MQQMGCLDGGVYCWGDVRHNDEVTHLGGGGGGGGGGGISSVSRRFDDDQCMKFDILL